MEYKCETCGKSFKTEEALEMHTKAKHSHEEEKKPINKKKIRGWIIFIIVLGFIIAGFYALSTTATSCDDPVTEINIGGHSNLALHIHPQLTITINGVQQTIPANLGVEQGIMRPMHTHDGSGGLHVEGPCKRDFTLGEFFQVWGQTFSSQCIFDNCVDDNNSLKVLVNGRESTEFQDLVMRDLQRVEIIYS